ncbi:zinc finger protein 395-like [Anarrhichthys ocellatus]|uniref:zinc finger protein 395-like n=1 Tax=Anarrhichthys ocellatus TaxID=433405 RepID=UPI0012EDDB46|nr:zinc finger protein 395-like [Anarrhichthys ocellatus]
MLPKTRLGKRSPFGALVMQAGTQTGVTMETAAGQQSASQVKSPRILKVYFQCGGSESSGVDQLDLRQSNVSVWSSSHPSSSSSSVPPSCIRSVSSYINVPRRRRSLEEVDMDELMAAMVLSSLSCSPAHPDPTAPLMDCGGSELSDSGSSGYWSVGLCNGSPADSPSIAQPDVGPSSPSDEGLDMELEQVLFNEPAPRKRRNSVKRAYRCLWPSCGKVLTSVVGIKRHIRTTHLCRGSEHERCSRSEEDFYYTEENQWDQQHQSPPHPLLFVSPNSSSSSPPSPPPPSPTSPPPPAHSRSAPSSSESFMQVQSEHSYQAPPLSHVTSAAVLNTCHWTAPPTSSLNQVSP